MVRKNSKAKCLRRQPEFSRLDKSRSFFLKGLTFLIMLLMGASLLYINTHVQVVKIGYEINQALNKKQNLIEENKLLELEIARLRSPTRIEKEAREKLGLSLPEPHQWVPLAQLSTAKQLFAKNPAEDRPQAPPSPEASKKRANPPQAMDGPSEAPKKVVLAKIIRSAPVEPAPLKTKEAIPAVLLDPMP